MIEIRVFEKGLDYAPFQNKVTEPELRSHFKKSWRRMHLKWHFPSKPTPIFSNVSWYTPKSSWKTPKGPRNFEVFSNLSGDGNFKIANSKLGYFNFSREEWQTMRALVDDKRTIIKKAEKGSSTFLKLKNNYVMIRIIEICHLMKRLYRIS